MALQDNANVKNVYIKNPQVCEEITFNRFTEREDLDYSLIFVNFFIKPNPFFDGEQKKNESLQKNTNLFV